MLRRWGAAPGLLLIATAAASAAPSACPSIGAADTQPAFDAAQLKEGRFIYRTTLKGESLGETRLEIRHKGARTLISMNAPDIGQSWTAEVERSFAPVASSLAMQTKKGDYRMTLRYAGNKVSGEERQAGETRPVQARVTGVVIDQRVDWAGIMAARAPVGSSIALHVFDPSTGSSAMLGHLADTPPMLGSWGNLPAVRLDYSICKREHLEEYTVFATRDTPRYMLREDMPNGLVSELVRIEP